MKDLFFRNQGISVFWVADFGNELHNSKINVADTK